MEEKKMHVCNGGYPKREYGPAITMTYEEEDGTLWVTNDEYGSQVNYCPFCGYKAKKQVEVKK